MNIKKKIIHYGFEVIKPNKLKLRYFCNRAVIPDKNKLTNDWNKVTCKNCLKQKNKVIERIIADQDRKHEIQAENDALQSQYEAEDEARDLELHNCNSFGY